MKKGRTKIEKIAAKLTEIRKDQGFTSTTALYTPAEHPWNDDWTLYGKVESLGTVTPIGKVPKDSRERIARIRKTTVQLILYFNDIEVSKTAWIPLSWDVMTVTERFEMELFSPIHTLTLMVVEQQNGKVRVLGKGEIPLPSTKEDDVALHEVVFECNTPVKP